ncbi:substrate-binding domain-containing protein [Streptomyces sp. NBC_00988]|uniref:sugar ABC transporter substrate-binding protein n=1 Tax=Streptomyces sp. NBC_00988 TaxID=2903704 RepID=UPI0038651A7A|nr:substrate-binding domain-containing protein [Streptomyces sp. NBC_00988]
MATSLLTTVSLLAAASCGSSTTPAASEGSADVAKCVAESGRAVTSHLASTSSNTYPTTKADGSLVKGKSYWLVALTTAVPTLAAYADSFTAAGRAAGAQVTVFDGKGTPATAAQGINSAIAAKADGIVLAAVDPQTVQQALTAAAAAGIPVLNGSGGDPKATSLPPGVVGNVTEVSADMGTWEGDYALHTTGCRTRAILVTSLSVPTAKVVTEATEARIKSLCGSSCATETLDVVPNDIATKTQKEMQTLLQRNPDTNVIVTTLNTYDPYIEQALKAVGRKIPIITNSPQGSLKGAVSDNTVANVLLPPPSVYGWFYFDGMVRSAGGGKAVSVTVPISMLDKSNWGSDPSTPASPRFVDYQQRFEAVWGIK